MREAVDGGHDGWMQDFGEGVPPSAVAHDGTTGSAVHNRYPTDYHCAVQRIVAATGRPLVRHSRSGWTGTARCAPVVWGGDPTTVFGYDGLASGVRQALGLGLSGVSRFGTDIGGYNTYGPMENLTPELLARWIEFGAVSGVMRTKRSGLAFPSYRRPQVYDPTLLPVWRRYTKLHTQLYPYVLAADANYRRTGLPLMRAPRPRPPRRPARAGDRRPAASSAPTCLRPRSSKPARRSASSTHRAGTWVDWWRIGRLRRAVRRLSPASAAAAGGRRRAHRPRAAGRAAAAGPAAEPSCRC